MANKDGKKLAKYTRDAQILEMAMAGVSNAEIADKFKIDRATADKIIDAAMIEAFEHYSNAAEQLAARKFMQIDVILNRLIRNFMEADDDEPLPLAIVDRIDKLVGTQIKIMNRPIAVDISDEKEKRVIRGIFSTSSPEYERALELASADPNYNPEDELGKLEAHAGEIQIQDGDDNEAGWDN